ncbi:unnamed protein product [Pleuronectes platessa]|uniref:Uncharacterized protein n=1 Tax=Pleuronectes platessa TaxID=8262 RepID=A0A9N7UBI1_PLEPL|nr:unnamed protein product [Pleuronectes platessa]
MGHFVSSAKTTDVTLGQDDSTFVSLADFSHLRPGLAPLRKVPGKTLQELVSIASQRSPSPGPNHVASSSSNAHNSASAPPIASSARPSCTFTPSLAAHFN